MANVSRLDDEDHVFGNVGGVIAHAFKVPGDENQVHPRLDDARIAEHVGVLRALRPGVK